jgi:hypothetical protein
MRLAAGRAITAVAFFALLSSACAKDTNLSKVFAAVRTFHSQFNAGRFHDMYANADARLRASISEDDFVAKLSSLRQSHGQIRDSGINGFEDFSQWQRIFPNAKPVRFVGFYNHCEQDGFQEFFQWDVQGNEAKLVTYENDLDDSNRARVK